MAFVKYFVFDNITHMRYNLDLILNYRRGSHMNEYCKICGSKTREIFYTKKNFKYYCCDKCEFISRDEASKVSVEAELKIYGNHNNSADDERYVAYFRKFIDNAIMDYHTGEKKGFDFGSGPIPVLSTVLSRDYGFEMDIYDLYYAKEKVYVGKTYSLVTSTEVVEHLQEPIEYFEIFKSLMKKDGILSIMTIFHPRNDEEFLGWHYMRDITHISFYTPKTMSYIAERLGFELIYCDNSRYTTFRLKDSNI